MKLNLEHKSNGRQSLDLDYRLNANIKCGEKRDNHMGRNDRPKHAKIK